MKKDTLKAIIKEEIVKLEEENPEFTIGSQDVLDSIDEESDQPVFSDIDFIRKEFLRFDSIYKQNLKPVLEKAEELQQLVKTNAKSLPPQVISDFRTILFKLEEIRKIKEQLINKINSVE